MTVIEIKQGENITVEKKDFEKSIFLLTHRPHRKKKIYGHPFNIFFIWILYWFKSNQKKCQKKRNVYKWRNGIQCDDWQNDWFFFAFFFLIIIQKNKTPCVCQWNRCHYYYFVNFVWKNFCFQKFQKFAFSTLSLVGPGYIQKFLKLFSFKLDFHWKKKVFSTKKF